MVFSLGGTSLQRTEPSLLLLFSLARVLISGFPLLVAVQLCSSLARSLQRTPRFCSTSESSTSASVSANHATHLDAPRARLLSALPLPARFQLELKVCSLTRFLHSTLCHPVEAATLALYFYISTKVRLTPPLFACPRLASSRSPLPALTDFLPFCLVSPLQIKAKNDTKVLKYVAPASPLVSLAALAFLIRPSPLIR
jgi:hypothetical protein